MEIKIIAGHLFIDGKQVTTVLFKTGQLNFPIDAGTKIVFSKTSKKDIPYGGKLIK